MGLDDKKINELPNKAVIDGTELLGADDSTVDVSITPESITTFGEGRFFRKDAHINASTGGADNGKPLVLNATGVIDPTLISPGSLTGGVYIELTDNADHTHTVALSNQDVLDLVNGVFGSVNRASTTANTIPYPTHSHDVTISYNAVTAQFEATVATNHGHGTMTINRGDTGATGLDGSDGADGSNGTNGSDGADSDMLKAIYDPFDISADVFSMGNMVETTGEKVFTLAERNKLIGIEALAEVNPGLVSQAEAEAGTSITERSWTAERVAQAIAALGGGGGGGLIESFKLNYTLSGTFGSASELTTGITNISVISDVNNNLVLTITFANLKKLPASMIYYGYSPDTNQYKVKIPSAISNVTTDDFGVTGAIMTLKVDRDETTAINGGGFPGTATHAIIKWAF